MPASPSIGQAWDDYFKQSHDKSYQFTEGLPFLQKFLRAPFMQRPLRYAQLAPKSKVLEAGCGSGKFSLSFALLGHTVVALDISAEILTYVETARQALESTAGRLALTTHQGDLENLDLPDNTFDLVINEGVVEHWLDQTARRRVLATMARVTKPGGTVAVIIPNGNHPEVDIWVKSHPAFLAAPPMVNYTPTLLISDLTAVGLTQVQVDGIYAWRTLGEWPRNHALLRQLGAALDKTIPLPHSVRLRWGLHLLGLARKPA